MGVIKMMPDTQNPEAGSARVVAIHRMIPTMITLMAMAAGLTSIQYALNSHWDAAVLAILLAAVLDSIDGATARFLKATSDFGAQMDSLSDFLSFGIAPAIIMYTWILEESGKVGWTAMIFYASATALRLARFNVEHKTEIRRPEGFFSGVPSPAGAGLILLPVILWMQYPEFFRQFVFASPLIGLWTIFVGTMMISRVPTFSLKGLRIPSNKIMMVLAGVALLIAALVHLPWPTLTMMGLAYMASIPVAIMRYRKVERSLLNDDDMADL